MSQDNTICLQAQDLEGLNQLPFDVLVFHDTIVVAHVALAERLPQTKYPLQGPSKAVPVPVHDTLREWVWLHRRLAAQECVSADAQEKRGQVLDTMEAVLVVVTPSFRVHNECGSAFTEDYHTQVLKISVIPWALG